MWPSRPGIAIAERWRMLALDVNLNDVDEPQFRGPP
jgi:hypothetical protein